MFFALPIILTRDAAARPTNTRAGHVLVLISPVEIILLLDTSCPWLLAHPHLTGITSASHHHHHHHPSIPHAFLNHAANDNYNSESDVYILGFLVNGSRSSFCFCSGPIDFPLVLRAFGVCTESSHLLTGSFSFARHGLVILEVRRMDWRSFAWDAYSYNGNDVGRCVGKCCQVAQSSWR